MLSEARQGAPTRSTPSTSLKKGDIVLVEAGHPRAVVVTADPPSRMAANRNLKVQWNGPAELDRVEICHDQ